MPVSRKKLTVKKEFQEVKKVKLSDIEKQQLQEFLPIFATLDLSEITGFRKLFKEIEAKYSVNEIWMKDFKNAVYHCNQVEYDEFINEITRK